ncbi:MAG: TRIC cation channel family protein [Clostridia bacterium]|nr:TRIC cation channel family protein [Clostridia bacterium]
MELVLTTMEIIGIIAAAIAGAMKAIDKKLDLFGVVLIGMITGLGGGVLRDVTLGCAPPRSFSNPAYLWSAFIPPLVVCLVALLLQEYYTREEKLIDRINNVVDALGLGAFAVGGAAVARAVGFDGNAVMVIFAGGITSVGGGVLRDIILREIPSVLHKRVYVVAALAGSVAYFLLLGWGAGEVWSSIAGVSIVFILRMLATIFHWNFPKAIK